jgi:hypothetical protein
VRAPLSSVASAPATPAQVEPVETSVADLSALLIVILAGMALVFSGAIIIICW